jgi:sporulation protein YlmC with PRC-barrel domain
MSQVRVFADFHNADPQGRLRLNCVGSIKDLACQNIELHEGRSLTLYSEDLEVEGVVQYSQEENLWVVAIDWNNIQQIDDLVIQAIS